MKAQRKRLVSCITLVGGVTLESCCKTVEKGWGSPCNECPEKTGGKLCYFTWWRDIGNLL